MTVIFENDSDIIVYALEKVITFARDNHYIFLAQSIWWISSIIGLQSKLMTYINNHQLYPKEEEVWREDTASISNDFESRWEETILTECEEYLKDSKHLRDIANLNSTGQTKTGRINPSRTMKKALKKKTWAKDYSRTEGIETGEIDRRKSAGEGLRCAWPSERKGSHRVTDCIRPIKKDKGTAGHPKDKVYQRKPSLWDSDKEE